MQQQQMTTFIDSDSKHPQKKTHEQQPRKQHNNNRRNKCSPKYFQGCLSRQNTSGPSRCSVIFPDRKSRMILLIHTRKTTAQPTPIRYSIIHPLQQVDKSDFDRGPVSPRITLAPSLTSRSAVRYLRWSNRAIDRLPRSRSLHLVVAQACGPGGRAAKKRPSRTVAVREGT